jgi:hypothetical protein
MHTLHLHLNSSGGNFRWVQQGLGLSLARTALSASASVLFSIIADVLLRLIIVKNQGPVKGRVILKMRGGRFLLSACSWRCFYL